MRDRQLVYGLHAVRHLLRQAPERIRRLQVQSGRRDQRTRDLIQLAQASGVRLEIVPAEVLDRLSPGARHQGVIAATAPAPVLSERDLPELLSALREPPLLLVLDGVQDPHNLGACLRLADAAGVHAVIAPKDRAAGLSGAARKVASGAAETMPFARVTNLARTLRSLREIPIRLVGAAREADGTLYQADLTGPLALVVGGEERGLRRLTRECCDTLISVPMSGSVESLNVSVATGICVYEALRQRRGW